MGKQRQNGIRDANQTWARGRHAVHSLEPRVLLYSYVTITTDAPQPLQVAPGQTIALTADIRQNDDANAIAADPTGTVTFFALPLRESSGPVIGTASNFTVVTPHLDTRVTATFTLPARQIDTFDGAAVDTFGDVVILAEYGGDANFPAEESGSGRVDPQNLQSRVDRQGQYVALSYATGTTPTATTLAVTAQPTNTAAGAKIDPAVQVSVLDAAGTVDTTSSASVTVALASTSTGTGHLTGMTTVAAVGGVATFADLSIDKAGQYGLTFADAAGHTTASGLFQVTAGHLVFTVPPANRAANRPLRPTVTVSLEDGSNTVVTDDSTSVVTLALYGTNSTNPITGNTATLVDGVARFPDLKLGRSGTYKLQATDDQDDADTLSGKFSIGGGTIAFAPQPADGDAGVPLAFAVTLRDDHHRIETDTTDSLQLTLNNTTPSNGALVSGTTTVPFVNGVARFADAQDVSIDRPGRYSFTATVVDGSGTPTGAAVAVTSRTFRVGGFHLAFVRPPASTDVNTPVPLTVAVKDGRNRTVTTANGGQLRIAFLETTGHLVNQPAFVDTAGLTSGVASIAGAGAPTFANFGTCRFRVFRYKDALTAEDDTAAVESGVVRIFGDKVVFILQPRQTDAGVPIEYKAATEDRHNRIITTFDGDTAFEGIDKVAATEPRTGSNFGHGDVAPTFTQGIADATVTVSTTSGDTPTSLSTSQVGTFRIHLVALGASGPEQAVEPATSAVFRVVPYHFAFVQQPLDRPVGTPVTATVTLVDVHNRPVAVPDGLDGFAFGVALVSTARPDVDIARAGGQSQDTNVNYAGGPDPITLPADGVAAGRYRLDVTVNNFSQDLFPPDVLGTLVDPDFVPTSSRVFSVR